jgi:hypothetical protein
MLFEQTVDDTQDRQKPYVGADPHKRSSHQSTTSDEQKPQSILDSLPVQSSFHWQDSPQDSMLFLSMMHVTNTSRSIQG